MAARSPLGGQVLQSLYEVIPEVTFHYFCLLLVRSKP